MNRKLGCLALLISISWMACGDDPVPGKNDAVDGGVDSATDDVGLESPLDAGGNDAKFGSPLEAGGDDAASEGGMTVGTCSPPGDAGDAGAADAGGRCNTLTNCAPDVVSTAGIGAPPTPTGGTIVDGLYALVAVRLYGQAPGGTWRVTIRKQGTTWQEVGHTTGPDNYANFIFSTEGTQLTFRQTCPGERVATTGYTATPTTYVEITSRTSTTSVFEFHRIPGS